MPVYNAEEYLVEAIESILSQTYVHFEFIIINDGSTDCSETIIDSYVESDHRVIHLKNKNQGISLSLNHGIQIAKGKYIARMDADDISFPNRFAEQIQFMEANKDIGVCGTWVDLIGDIRAGEFNRHPIEDEELKVRLLFTVCFVHPSVVMRRELLVKTNNFYNEKYTSAQDYDLWARLKDFTKFSNIPQTLMQYRISKDSVSALANNAKTEKRYDLISSVSNKMLATLGMSITVDESVRHYKLGLNSRLRSGSYCINTLGYYFEQIIDANNQSQKFCNKYLRKYLAEKYAYAVIFRLKKSIKTSKYLFSSLFIIGFYQISKKMLSKKIHKIKISNNRV